MYCNQCPRKEHKQGAKLCLSCGSELSYESNGAKKRKRYGTILLVLFLPFVIYNNYWGESSKKREEPDVEIVAVDKGQQQVEDDVRSIDGEAASESQGLSPLSSFKSEVEGITGLLSCGYKKMHSPEAGWGRMFSCVDSDGRLPYLDEESLKLYVNEDPSKNDKVVSIKLLWHHKSGSLHSNAESPIKWATALATRYIPEDGKNLVEQFVSHEINEEIMLGDEINITITFDPESRSGLDLHMMEIKHNRSLDGA